MLTGYFDDSGPISTGAVVACGWVSTVEQWEQFDENWRFVLAKFELPYFHMKSLRQYKGPFEQFKDNLPRETDLMTRLQGVIRVRAQKSIGCLVDVNAYESVNREYRLNEMFGHPFAFAGCSAIYKTLKWLERVHPNTDIAFVFEAGTKGWGTLVEAARKQMNVTPILGDWEKLTPIQAADFVAWENHRAYQKAKEHNFAARSTRFRGSFSQFIRDHGGDDWYVADEPTLHAFCSDALHSGENALERRLA
jgi:hypothetical protein